MYVFWIKINKGGRIYLRFTHQLTQILKDRPKCLKKKYLWTKVVSIGNPLMACGVHRYVLSVAQKLFHLSAIYLPCDTMVT